MFELQITLSASQPVHFRQTHSSSNHSAEELLGSPNHGPIISSRSSLDPNPFPLLLTSPLPLLSWTFITRQPSRQAVHEV
jgi:hypothetical protein